MRIKLLLALPFIILIGFVNTAQAQTFTLNQSNGKGIYKSGEKIRITAYITNRNAIDTLWVKVMQNNNNIILQKPIIPATDSVVVFENSFKKPCSVIVETKMKGNKQMLGMIVDPQKIKPGTVSPKDLKKYWETERNKHLKHFLWM